MARPRKFDFESTPSGFPPADDAIIRKSVEQFRNMMVQNYATIRDFKDQSEDGKVRVGFSCLIQTGGKKPVIKSSLRFARPVSDECEDVVENPDQTTLPLDPQSAAQPAAAGGAA